MQVSWKSASRNPDRADNRITVESSAFPGPSLTADRWRSMADGHAYKQAGCIVGFTADGAPTGATTVWSAGTGRPGVIEHRRRRHLLCGWDEHPRRSQRLQATLNRFKESHPR